MELRLETQSEQAGWLWESKMEQKMELLYTGSRIGLVLAQVEKCIGSDL